jgi:hypothetical protein
MERRDKDEETPLAVPIPSFGRGGGPRRAAPGPHLPRLPGDATKLPPLLSTPCAGSAGGHPFAETATKAAAALDQKKLSPTRSVRRVVEATPPPRFSSLARVRARASPQVGGGRSAGPRGAWARRVPPPQKILGAPGTAGRGLDSRGISWTRRGFVAVRRAGRAASCGAAGPAQRDRVLVPPGALSGRARAFCATAGLLRAAASSCNLLVCV